MKDQNKIKVVTIVFQGQFPMVSVSHFWNSHREGSGKGRWTAVASSLKESKELFAYFFGLVTLNKCLEKKKKGNPIQVKEVSVSFPWSHTDTNWCVLY